MKRRRSRKESDRPKKAAQVTPEDDELPTLEPIEDEEELETLEEWDGDDDGDDSGMAISHSAESGEFDVKIVIDVGEMEKAEITGAIEAPLRRKAAALGDEVRWKNVLVEFGGEALIPSAAKATIGEIFEGAKALSATVNRGLGNEKVFEGSKPELATELSESGGEIRLDVSTGELDPDDVDSLFRPELDKLAAAAADKPVRVAFDDDFELDMRLHKHVRTTLVDAGASRVAIGDEVVFDRAIEERVVVADGSGDFETEIQVADGDSATLRASFDAAIPKNESRIAGKRIMLRCASGDEAVSRDRLVAAGALVVAVARGGSVEQLWPTMVTVTGGQGAATIRVDAGGRDRSEVLAKFGAEIEREADALRGRALTVDWPSGYMLDEEIEQVALDDSLRALDPKSVHFSIDGEEREPFFPNPIEMTVDGQSCRCEIDTDAGKPVELVRAMDRRIGGSRLDGATVNVLIRGDGAVSRTMRQRMRELFGDAGVAFARLDDRGETMVLLPSLLGIETGDAGTRITIDASGREEGEIEADARKEIEAAEIGEGATVTVVDSERAEMVTPILKELGCAEILLERDRGTVLIHPALLTLEQDGKSATLTATPTTDDAGALAQFENEFAGMTCLMEGVDVTLAWGDGASIDTPSIARAVELLVEASAAKVSVARAGRNPKQVHPKVERKFVEVIGRRDAGDPPMSMIAIDCGEGADDIPEIQSALATHAKDTDGRRVLVVFRDHGNDVALPAGDAVVTAVCAALEGSTKALLVYGDGDMGAHFTVMRSELEALAVGTRVRDPRQRS